MVTNYERLQGEYEARLGRMTLKWNLMEAGLDCLVECLFWLHDLKTVGIEARPLSLEQKLTVVKEAHNKIPAIGPFKSEGLRLAVAVSDIMHMRHQLTHGYPAHFLVNGDVMLMAFRFKPDGPTMEWPIHRAQKINQLGNKAQKLFAQIVAHIQTMKPGLEEMKQAYPQVAQEAAQRLDGAIRRLPASEREAWPQRRKPRG